MTNKKDTPVRSVRIENEQWAKYQRDCGLPPETNTSDTLKRILECFENSIAISAELERISEENHRLKAEKHNSDEQVTCLISEKQQLVKQVQGLEAINKELDDGYQKLSAQARQWNEQKQGLEKDIQWLLGQYKLMKEYLEKKGLIDRTGDKKTYRLENPPVGQI